MSRRKSSIGLPNCGHVGWPGVTFLQDQAAKLSRDDTYVAGLADREPTYRVEVRKTADGSVDEVLLYDGQRCLFHMEQMAKASWWFALYPVTMSRGADVDRHFRIFRDGKRVRVTEG